VEKIMKAYTKKNLTYMHKKLVDDIGKKFKVISIPDVALLISEKTTYEEVLKKLAIIKIEIVHRIQINKISCSEATRQDCTQNKLSEEFDI
jgi:hypothetical protein